MATNTNSRFGPLEGLDAVLASQPIDYAVRGGTQDGFDGVAPTTTKASPMDQPQTPADRFAGMGALLEEQDEGQVFKTIHNQNLRQERLARNRLAQDQHWLAVMAGFTFSKLEKLDNQDVWKQSWPPGYDALRQAAVPNKAADLCNKYVETLLNDLPKPKARPADDSEAGERGSELLNRFLLEDGDQDGTDDAAVFWDRWQRAMATASTFTHYYVDPTGSGSVPLQIKAHPLATDVANPLVGIDPATGQETPTTDYVLRYVTPEQDGQPAQFTDDPSQADRQWLPKIMIDRLGREHVRTYPEYVDVDRAQQVLVLYFMTIAEGKRRFPETVGQLDASQLQQLCDWTPPRYLYLLPPALRARWKLSVGGQKDLKGGSDDQRLFFYYAFYGKEEPDYPKGYEIWVNGMDGGYVIHRDTLALEVDVPSKRQQDETVKDCRPCDIPVVQHRPIQDSIELDPMGVPLVARFAGGSEAGGQLVQGYLEAMDITLHPARYTPSTSPIEREDVDESRATGSFVTVLSPNDYPQYEVPPVLPNNFLQTVGWLYNQNDLIAGLPKPMQGAADQQEVSGVARDIAVREGMKSMGRSQQAMIGAFKRHWRIKGQLALKKFSVPQQMAYVGEDGAYQQEWWTGADLAAVASAVDVQPGTGTMMSAAEKVQYVASMRQMGFMSDDEAQDVARPTFAGTLGVPEDPHVQRVERQISSFLEGPPEGWLEQAAQYDAVVQAAEQAAQQAQMQAQAQAVQAQQQQVQAQQGAALQAEDRVAQRQAEIERQKTDATVTVARERNALELEKAKLEREAAAEKAKIDAELKIELERLKAEAAAHLTTIAGQKAAVPQAVHVHPPAKPVARKGTITGPSGKTYTVELGAPDGQPSQENG